MPGRRDFLKISGLGLAAVTTAGFTNTNDSNITRERANYKFRLGMASYTFRNFSLEQALDMTQRLDLHRISLKDVHLALDSSKEEIARAVALCKAKGIELYGGGVIYMKNTADVDNAFEYAKAAGMRIIIGVPNHELLGYVERKVKDYDIKLAIHNHGPGDNLYPSAASAYEKIKDMDKRMGLCIDIGHTKRINRNPEQDLKDFFERVYDIHIKDVTAADQSGAPCEIGRGVIDIPAFLGAVIMLGYTGTLALEYEKDAKDPLPGAAESIGYLKGVLANI